MDDAFEARCLESVSFTITDGYTIFPVMSLSGKEIPKWLLSLQSLSMSHGVI
jgi:hypothetical protein